MLAVISAAVGSGGVVHCGGSGSALRLGWVG